MNCCHSTEVGTHTTAVPAMHRMPVLDVLPYPPLTGIAPALLIGVVVDSDDTNDAGIIAEANQALVQFSTKTANKNQVLAEISRGLNVAPGDRVLFVMPANASMAVITSVLSPAGQAATCQSSLNPVSASNGSHSSQELVLRDTDSLCVTTSSGQTLVAIERGATGPIIRLGQGSLQMDMPGELHLMADSLRFTTRSGPISIESQTDDVIVQGRTIRLN